MVVVDIERGRFRGREDLDAVPRRAMERIAQWWGLIPPPGRDRSEGGFYGSYNKECPSTEEKEQNAFFVNSYVRT